MKPHIVPVEKAGAYIFQGPGHTTVSLNRELLVLACIPSRKTVATTLFPSECSPNECTEHLNTMYDTLSKDFGVKPTEIQIKIFGMATLTHPILAAVKTWLTKHDLKVTAEDIGRNAFRALQIDCDSGRVGVSYSEAFISQTEGLLASGSASGRNGEGEDLAPVLVLTQNRVTKRLVQQAIEENGEWKAEIPDSPFDLFIDKKNSDFPWKAVLVCEDLGSPKPLDGWLTRMKKVIPDVSIFWVGETKSKLSHEMESLPEVTPQTLKDFKQSLHSQVKLAMNGPGQVLSFPTPKKAKKK